MKIRQIMALTGATVVCGNGREDHEVQCAFASDLMSDVLTLDCNGVLLVTGLCNMQTIRTAEMADVSCILFVRGKKATPDILQRERELFRSSSKKRRWRRHRQSVPTGRS